MTDSEMKAVLSRSVIEETSTSVRLHKGQEYQSGILPKAGGEQYREIVVGASSLVKGSVVGKDIVIESAEDINISKSEKAPGTEIQGSVNALGDVDIGKGVWIQGGIIALGLVKVQSYLTESDIPSHVLIEGGVSGSNVIIGDGVVILGPVVAHESIKIGNNVTIRDHVSAPDIELGDGCLIGGLQAQTKFKCGLLNTISASQILLPMDTTNIDIHSGIRSPYPACNSCPSDSVFETNSGIARKLACHLFAERKSNEIIAGPCDHWKKFPIEDVEQHLEGDKFRCVSLIPKTALNIRKYAEKATIWERGGES